MTFSFCITRLLTISFCHTDFLTWYCYRVHRDSQWSAPTLWEGDYMEIIPLMCALPLSTSHSNKWVNWLWAIKKLNETNKMCVLIFLDSYFVWGLVNIGSHSFYMESNYSTLINIVWHFSQTLMFLFNTSMCLLAQTTDCDRITTQVGNKVEF
jgi:hypothetical protein